MIGYHAVSVIADAAVKGIDGFDLQKAFAAMKQSAELREHRGLGAYIDKGFIAMEEERESVSKVLEYAYDDWCIAQVARMLGEDGGLQALQRACAVVQERLRSGFRFHARRAATAIGSSLSIRARLRLVLPKQTRGSTRSLRRRISAASSI